MTEGKSNSQQLERSLLDFERTYKDSLIGIPEADAFLKEYNDFQTKLVRIQGRLDEHVNKVRSNAHTHY